jgi:cob(I)alamin adenosyltransferase
MKIYTKTGDGGQSCLYNGTRLSKSSNYFIALGDLDELNAHLGMVKALWRDEQHVDTEKYEWYSLGITVTEIQQNIMDICSTIATPGSDDRFFNPDWITKIEEKMDRLDLLLPPLTKFVIPSGNKLCASVHIARAVCRRAERHMIEVITPGCPSHIYINRLSDYLFMVSRFVCVILKIQEYLKK